MAEDVLVERGAGLLTITLNRPHARNAVNRSVSESVAAAIDELETDEELGAGILTGAGGNFCAGMDLKAFAGGELPEIEGRGFAGLTQAPPSKPLIAAVEGFALAGGCELVLACDLVVATTDASFGLPEVTRGLIAGSGGLFRLPGRVPLQIALEHALTGEPIPATEAHHWGLVNRLTDPGGALPAARSLAGRILRNAPLAVRKTKQVMFDAPSWPAGEVWQRQHAALRDIFDSADAAEGARAFAERREPRWQGR